MIALAFLIISSIIGAGFATGAELVAFFGNRNISPVWAGLAVSSFMLALSALILFIESRKRDEPPLAKQKQPHDGTGETTTKSDTARRRGVQLRLALPKGGGALLFKPIYFIFFLAMTAGIYELSGWVGAIISIVLCIYIILFGFDALVRVNKYLIMLVLGVLFIINFTNQGLDVDVEIEPSQLRVVPWALLYVAMNVALLGSLFRNALQKHSAKKIFLACGLAAKIVGSLVFLSLRAIYANDVQNEVMPILALSNNWVTFIAIFLSIFTSQAIALFNLTQNMVTPNAKSDTKFSPWLRGVAPRVSRGDEGCGMSTIPNDNLPHPSPLRGTPLSQGENFVSPETNIKEARPSPFLLLFLSLLALFSPFLGFQSIVNFFYPGVGLFMVLYIGYSLLRIKYPNNRTRIDK